MSHPFVNGRNYDIYYSDSDNCLNESGLTLEDMLGSFLIFYRKAGVSDNDFALEDQRIIIPFGVVRKAIELPVQNIQNSP